MKPSSQKSQRFLFSVSLPIGLLLLIAAPGCKTGADVDVKPASTSSAPSASSSTNVTTATDPVVLAKPDGGGTDADRTAIAQGEQAFASNLFAKLPHDKNLFFSPTSIRMALAMTYAGAKGDTAKEMAKTLSFDSLVGSDPKKVHDGFSAELRDFASMTSPPVPADAKDWQIQEAERKKQTVRIVNRVWGQQGRAFKPDYLSLLQTSYDAPLEQLDFAKQTEKSRVRINSFIADKTEQKIKELIPAGTLTADERLVLTNAVYFKAGWEEPFTESQTKEDAFYINASKSVKAKLMEQTHQFRYAQVGDAQVVELPYASGRMSMVVVLPSAKDGLAKLEQSMNDKSLTTWTGPLRSTRVDLTLPKFTMTSDFMLSKVLPSMGMQSAFDSSKADFSGMDGTKELFIGEVIHKAFVAVDEKGTEAAAATAVLMKAGAAMPTDKPIEIRADHPFIFFIRDTQTNAVLFMGRVVDPTAAT